jgi:hypothetical protein
VADFWPPLESAPPPGALDLVVAEKGTIDQRNVVKFTVTAKMTLESAESPQPPAAS